MKIKKLLPIGKIVLIFFAGLCLNSHALKTGQVVKYHGREWVIRSIHNNRTVTLCPHYNYDNFFYGEKWGWFYDSKCRSVPLDSLLPIKKKENRGYTPVRSDNLTSLALNPEYLNSLTAEQFKEMYKKVTDIAVMHPTEKNIKAYMFMTNFLRLKALVFAHSINDFVMANPKFNRIKETGETSWSAFSETAISKRKIKKFIKEHSRNMGLMAFIKNGCPYCMRQIPVLAWFKADYGIDILLVSMNGCPENTMGLPCTNNPQAFYTYRIGYEPTIILVVRGRNNRPAFFPIGVGLTNGERISKRIYYYARTYFNPEERYTDKNFLHLLEEGK